MRDQLVRSARMLKWYSRRPQLYPAMARHILATLGREIEPDEPGVRALATEWCATRAVTVDDAIRSLFHAPPDVLTSMPAEELARADRREDARMRALGGPADIRLLFGVSEGIRARTVVETGVASGWSSLAFLLSLQNRGGHLYSTDMPYPLHDLDDSVGAVVPSELRGFWSLFQVPDRDGIPRIERLIAAADVIHYDSAKDAKSRCWAYPRLWRLLRPDGVFISDDIGDNFAFRDLAESVARPATIVQSDEAGRFVGILLKQDTLASTGSASTDQ